MTRNPTLALLGAVLAGLIAYDIAVAVTGRETISAEIRDLTAKRPWVAFLGGFFAGHCLTRGKHGAAS